MSTLPPPPPPPEPLPSTAQPPAAPPTPPEAMPQPAPTHQAQPPQPTPYPQAASPFTQPPSAPPPAEPRSSSGRAAAIIGIGITLTLVVLAGALFALFSTLSNSFNQPAADDKPPVVAEDEAPCAGCLTLDDALGLRLPDGIPTLGLTLDEDAGFAKPSIIGSYADSSLQTYEDGDGDPLGCSFAIDYAPESPSNPDEVNRTDRVGDLGSYYNDTDYLTLVTRVFETESDAAAYPATLRDGIAACPHYSFSYSEGEDFWSTDMQPLELATSSPAVTAVGWREHYGDADLMIVDLQYANLAIRAIFNRTGAPATDEQFRAFVVELSTALEGLGN
jgi:hypothetical protein